MLSRLGKAFGRLGWRFQRSRRGNVAVEFALIGPVMITMVLGVFDISKGLILYQEVYNSAHDSALAASIIAMRPDTTTSLTAAQAQWVMSLFWAEMPWVRAGIEKGARSVTLSSITFVPDLGTCVPSSTVACPTTANVAWSVAYMWGDHQSTQLLRSCGTEPQVSATAVSPFGFFQVGTSGVSNPDPILVVDVHYQYTPLFFTFITGPIDFRVSAYWPVRSAPSGTATWQQYTKYDTTNQLGGLNKCAGWP